MLKMAEQTIFEIVDERWFRFRARGNNMRWIGSDFAGIDAGWKFYDAYLAGYVPDQVIFRLCKKSYTADPQARPTMRVLDFLPAYSCYQNLNQCITDAAAPRPLYATARNLLRLRAVAFIGM